MSLQQQIESGEVLWLANLPFSRGDEKQAAANRKLLMGYIGEMPLKDIISGLPYDPDQGIVLESTTRISGQKDLIRDYGYYATTAAFEQVHDTVFEEAA
jgi:hypothetical protein